MRIGFDAKRLFCNKTGLGNYARTTVKTLVTQFPDHKYFLFTPAIDESIDTSWFVEHPLCQIIRPRKYSLFWRSREIRKIIKSLNLDIYHGLSHELPFGPKPSRTKYLLTMHDLIWEIYPAYYPWIDRIIYSYKYRKSVRKADHIVSVSKCTKEDLVTLWNVDAEKISVVYQSCQMPRKHPSGKKGKYFLYIGSIEKRKNGILILKALKSISPADRPLMHFIGSGGSYMNYLVNYVEKENLVNHVRFLGSVPNEDLKDHYDNAYGLILPSYYEGFGIPIIEAGMRSIPSITTKKGALPEAAGPGAIFIDPNAPEGLAQAIIKLMNEKHLRSQLGALAYSYSTTSFDGIIQAEKLMRIYRQMIGVL